MTQNAVNADCVAWSCRYDVIPCQRLGWCQCRRRLPTNHATYGGMTQCCVFSTLEMLLFIQFAI